MVKLSILGSFLAVSMVNMVSCVENTAMEVQSTKQMEHQSMSENLTIQKFIQKYRPELKALSLPLLVSFISALKEHDPMSTIEKNDTSNMTVHLMRGVFANFAQFIYMFFNHSNLNEEGVRMYNLSKFLAWNPTLKAVGIAQGRWEYLAGGFFGLLFENATKSY